MGKPVIPVRPAPIDGMSPADKTALGLVDPAILSPDPADAIEAANSAKRQHTEATLSALSNDKRIRFEGHTAQTGYLIDDGDNSAPPSPTVHQTTTHASRGQPRWRGGRKKRAQAAAAYIGNSFPPTTPNRGHPHGRPIIVGAASQFPTNPHFTGTSSPVNTQSETQYIDNTVFNPVTSKTQRFERYRQEIQPALSVCFDNVLVQIHSVLTAISGRVLQPVFVSALHLETGTIMVPGLEWDLVVLMDNLVDIHMVCLV